MQRVDPGIRAYTDIPELKGYPVVGILPRYRFNLPAAFVEAQRSGGDVVRIRYGTLRFYLLSHPDHVEWVLQRNARNYLKGFNRAKIAILLGNGLVVNEGASWLRQRRLMQPAFHRQHLERFAEAMVEEIGKMLERWEIPAATGQPLDAAKEMKHLTRRVIMRTMFGLEEGDEEGERIAQAFRTALSTLGVRYLLPLWFGRLPLGLNRRFERALAVLDEKVYRIIAERRRDGTKAHDDLLSMLMEARDEESGEPMTEKQLRDEVLLLYLAGHETTANTLSWVWYLLSRHPEARRRVHEEASRILGSRPPAFKDLPQLLYTRMVIDETLRLYPPADTIIRKPLEDDVIGGYRIPAGSGLALSPYVTHHRADLWDNPEGFDPERFAPGKSQGRPRYAYYPFGGGPRQCIGNGFALMEATLVVAAVARRYRLDLIPGQEVKARVKGTLAPHPGVLVKLRHAAGTEADRR